MLRAPPRSAKRVAEMRLRWPSQPRSADRARSKSRTLRSARAPTTVLGAISSQPTGGESGACGILMMVHPPGPTAEEFKRAFLFGGRTAEIEAIGRFKGRLGSREYRGRSQIVGKNTYRRLSLSTFRTFALVTSQSRGSELTTYYTER
jgi:hypothetical protein